MSRLTVELIPILSDNYCYLLRTGDGGATAVVDPGEAEPVLALLDRLGLALTHILLTHHHGDHIAGAGALKSRFGATVIGPAANAAQIPLMDVQVLDGDIVELGGHRARVIATPGHTRGHIAFHFAEDEVLFAGDTLFALGCGRLFEDSAEAMWASLSRLRALPDSTRLYCGHEYTLSNARFALAIDGANQALRARVEEVEAVRDQGAPTIPSTLGEEKRTNPFLRADDPALQHALGLAGRPPAEVFAEIRRRKDAA